MSKQDWHCFSRRLATKFFFVGLPFLLGAAKMLPAPPLCKMVKPLPLSC